MPRKLQTKVREPKKTQEFQNDRITTVGIAKWLSTGTKEKKNKLLVEDASSTIELGLRV